MALPPARPAGARVWQRAAVLGSLWAASEIVVGSFLHNLRIPFAGSLLAAIGVILTTAGHRAMPERGVIWRAALVCALMKSMSPSAVILGPMVGILAEGLLLEAAVAALGGNAAGYLVGGALAVSWSLTQRIVSAVIAFGPDVVRLYVEAYRFAARSLGVTRFGPFDLVGTFFALECAAGAVAAVVGMRLGRRPGSVADTITLELRPPATDARQRVAQGTWSLGRLAAAVVALLVGMALVGAVRLPLAVAFTLAYAVWVFRTYPRSMARLRRPMFWIQACGIMLLAGLLLGGVQGGRAGLLDGLLVGAQMVLRAMLVLFGFSAISVELRSPRILAWLERRQLRGLSDALGVAFGVLPAFSAALAGQRAFRRHPWAVLAGMLQLANNLSLSHGIAPGGVVVLTGRTGSGKTTRAGQVVGILRARGVRVAGVLARGLLTGSRRSGFDLVDLATGRTAPLCRVGEPGGPGHERCGPFEFTAAGLAFGRAALSVRPGEADVVVIDEVGPLELAGGGWAGALDALAGRFDGVLLVVARLAVVESIKARWGTPATPVCEAVRDAPEAIADRVAGVLRSGRARVEAVATDRRAAG